MKSSSERWAYRRTPLQMLTVAFCLSLAVVSSPVLALTDEETKRAEALIPMLDGKQELWAIGEFVHLGPQAVPVLAKALQHPGRREDRAWYAWGASGVSSLGVTGRAVQAAPPFNCTTFRRVLSHPSS